MTKKERGKKPAKHERVEVAPVVTHELGAAELIAVAQAMLRAGYQTNGTPTTLRVMAEALRLQLTQPVRDAETIKPNCVPMCAPRPASTP